MPCARTILPSSCVIILGSMTTGTILLSAGSAGAQTNAPVPVLKINAAVVTAKASPTLYGLMTEEINFSYEGGLYGELIRNRSFKAGTNDAKFWSATGSGTIALDFNDPLNSALGVSLKLDAPRRPARLCPPASAMMVTGAFRSSLRPRITPRFMRRRRGWIQWPTHRGHHQ